MKITRTSMFSGNVNVMDIPFTAENAETFLKMEQVEFLGRLKWQIPGVLIQDAFPNLTPDEREFLMTGITPEEWNTVFGAEDDEQ